MRVSALKIPGHNRPAIVISLLKFAVTIRIAGKCGHTEQHASVEGVCVVLGKTGAI